MEYTNGENYKAFYAYLASSSCIELQEVSATLKLLQDFPWLYYVVDTYVKMFTMISHKLFTELGE